MTRLERTYRLLLLAYPRGYREQRGEELVATLMDASAPGRQWPGVADAADLVAHGLQARAGARAFTGRGQVLAAAGPIGLGLAAGLSTILLLFGELKTPGLWRPGVPNGLFGFGPFETTGVVVYAGCLLAVSACICGWARASRAIALCTVGVCWVMLEAPRGLGRAHASPVILACLGLCLVPAVLAVPSRSVGQRLTGATAALVSLVVGLSSLLPASPNPGDGDSRLGFLMAPGGLHPWWPRAVQLGFAAAVLIAAATGIRGRRWTLLAATLLFAAPAVMLSYVPSPEGSAFTGFFWSRGGVVGMSVALAAAAAVLSTVVAGLAKLDRRPASAIAERRPD